MSSPYPGPRPGARPGPRPGPVPTRGADHGSDAGAGAGADGLAGWDEPDAGDVEQVRPGPSGIARVDAVVDGLADLGSRDLAEHPAAYEQAHTELRRALDEPAGGPT